MFLLSLGLILFIAIHLTPSFPVFRQKLISRLGELGYKAVFSLLSIAAIVIVVKGKASASFVAIWDPFSWGKLVVIPMMVAAIILFISSNFPSNLKRITPHPISWGVILWAVAHLLVNGDLASLILFGGFGLFTAVSIISANMRGASISSTAVPVRNDVILVVLGLLVYGAIAYFHGSLFGVALF